LCQPRYLGVDDIEKRSLTGGDADVPDLGTFDTKDMALSFAWANKMDMFSGGMHYGVGLKFISSDLNTEKAQTIAVDLGLLHNFNQERNGMVASLAVLNLGGELKFKDEGDPLPLNVKPGVAYRMDVGSWGNLTGALDADLLLNDGLAVVKPGLELWIRQMFAVRAGFDIGRDEDAGSGASFGTGLRLYSFGLDYAFVPFDELGDTHRVSIGFKF